MILLRLSIPGPEFMPNIKLAIHPSPLLYHAILSGWQLPFLREAVRVRETAPYLSQSYSPRLDSIPASNLPGIPTVKALLVTLGRTRTPPV